MGLKITSYTPAKLYPIDSAHPAESEFVVTSDWSGDDITDGPIWNVGGDIVSQDEMLDAFFDDYITVLKPGDEKYEKAKAWLKDTYGWDEEDFDDQPNIYEIDYGDTQEYCLEDDYDPIGDELIPDDWYEVDPDDLEPEEDDNEPDYDGDY